MSFALTLRTVALECCPSRVVVAKHLLFCFFANVDDALLPVKKTPNLKFCSGKAVGAHSNFLGEAECRYHQPARPPVEQHSGQARGRRRWSLGGVTASFLVCRGDDGAFIDHRYGKYPPPTPRAFCTANPACTNRPLPAPPPAALVLPLTRRSCG